MKHIPSILGLSLTALLLGACQSTPYHLISVAPQRLEVTRALDAAPLAKAETFVSYYRGGVDSLEAGILGQSEQYMTGHRPESLLSNWVADAFVEAARQQGYEADLGICNIGGLRAAMPAGDVRRGDILAISPFENFFTILKLKGSDVEQLMHDIAAVHGEGISSGARLVITRDGRLKSATIGGQPIDPARLYTIATLDYLADGNDKIYSLKRSVERTVTTVPARDVLMQRLRQLSAEGRKATAQIDGRITQVDEGEAPPQVRQTELGSAARPFAVSHATPTGKTRQLLVVHTNDTHSCVDPLNPNLSDTAQADKGGYVRRATLVRQLRQHDPDLLLLDAGDFSQGSAFYSLYHGDVEVGLMNLMGYDAATIGNHEFDFGLENMARLFRQARFPIVCCNYDFTGTPVEGLVKPYTIIRRGGLKIGILGVSPQLEGLVSAHTCQGVRYTDPIVAAQPVADYLKHEAQCDLVVCVSHLGWQLPGVSDEEFIPATRNIDIVIGGHSHTYFTAPQVMRNADGAYVPDNQMGKNGRYVGTLRLTLQR